MHSLQHYSFLFLEIYLLIFNEACSRYCAVSPSGPRHSFPQQQGVLATEGSQLCPIQVALDWRKLQILLLPQGNPHPIICWCADTKDCPLQHLNWETTEGPSFRVPHNIGRSCCCNCIAVQVLPQPNSTFIVPSKILIQRSYTNVWKYRCLRVCFPGNLICSGWSGNDPTNQTLKWILELNHQERGGHYW